jgi:hypothetical protein
MTAGCPVRAWCRVPTHCPFCVAGSEYTPRPGGPRHPAAIAAHAARQAARQVARTAPAARRGRGSVRKGRALEREFARRFGGQRVPLSGALAGLPNDVVLPNGWRVEVKGRAAAGGRVYGWLAAAPAVAFRAPGQAWLVAVTEPVLDAILAGTWPGRLPAAPRPGGYGPVALAVRDGAAGVATWYQWLQAEHADLVGFRANRRPWIAVVPWDRLRLHS